MKHHVHGTAHDNEPRGRRPGARGLSGQLVEVI